VNWTWRIRARDGAMNGLEFTSATTASGFSRVLVHAAPAQASVEVSEGGGRIVLRSDADRDGGYTPMTLLEIDGGALRRSEIWPGQEHEGLPVLLAGGEVGVLLGWQHADDRSWWRWTVEFSNHTGRPDDWAPDGQHLLR
jgi:hypothetical protein